MTRTLEHALRELTRRVMGRPGVSGTAIGDSRGKPCLKVYVSDPKIRDSIPSTHEGYPVVVETTGPFKSR